MTNKEQLTTLEGVGSTGGLGMKKLKYKIYAERCDFWGYKPFIYIVRWEGRVVVAQGFVEAASRDLAVLYANKITNVHRAAFNGRNNYYAVSMA